LLVALATPASQARSASNARDPGTSKPATGATPGDSYELVARFDSGHLLFAIAGVGDIGFGDDNAGAVGFLVDPDGRALRFSRTERNGESHVTNEGKRLDLRSIVLDRSGPTWRFAVDKDELRLALAIRAEGAAPLGAGSPGRAAARGCPAEVLANAAPASGTLRRPGMPPIELAGRVSLTHRLTNGPLADCQLRRTEFFGLDGSAGVYFAQVETPDGARVRWLLVSRDGRVVYAGAPDSAQLVWRDDGDPASAGFPQLERIRFTASDLSGSVEVGPPAVEYDPIERLTAPLRWAVLTRMNPRLLASPSRFELGQSGGWHPSGVGIARVTYANPLPPGHRDPPLATGGE
jgi:hypothetical protein